jgi:predicted MFS family arabinose efflux permease
MENSTSAAQAPAPDLAPDTKRTTTEILAYFGGLALLQGFTGPGSGLVNIPVMFFLKDRLHLSAEQVAWFVAVGGIPIYLGFVFGFFRDRWSPFGQGDRAYLWLAVPPSVALYLWLAHGEITYGRLLFAVILLRALFQVIGAAVTALMTVVAQRAGMAGRLSSLHGVTGQVPGIMALLAGGWLAAHLGEQQIFVLAAGLTALLLVPSFWQPGGVFREIPSGKRRHEDRHWDAIRRVFAHRAVWPAALVQVLWQFGLCFGTPLFFYMTDTVHLSREQIGVFEACTTLGFLPTTLIYGLVCARLRMRPMLAWGTLFAVIQPIPLIFAHDFTGALAAGLLVGITGGFASTAYYDLAFRSSPRSLEGTAMTLIIATGVFATKASEVAGAWLYKRGGFELSAWMTTAVYLLIVPALLLIPRHVTQPREGIDTVEVE